MALRTSAAVGLPAIVLCMSLPYHPVQADPYLPNLPNLNFESYTGSAPKNYFTNVDPTGWTGGSDLVFIDSNAPGQTACGPVYLQTYGCPSVLAIDGGNYNYVEADGNPLYESGFNYTVTGLTVGETYTLSFYQAASQQTTFATSIPTTEQWIVSLGTAGMVISGGGPDNPIYGPTDVYSNGDPDASIAATPLMTTPAGGLTDWNFVSVNLTADATTDILSFLAWGDDGSTINLPPIAFLTGVNSPAGFAPSLGVPEPASLSLFGAGVLGLGAALRRRRAKKTTV